MSCFLRVLDEGDKAKALLQICTKFRSGTSDPRLFEVTPESFDAIPGKPFAYWTSKGIREAFEYLPPFGSDKWSAWVGLQTNDDFQWVRLWWESDSSVAKMFSLSPFAKGGSYSPFYSDVYLAVRWGDNGKLIKTWKEQQLLQGLITANNSRCWNEKNYFDAGITWPRRTQAFGPRALPAGCIFGDKGPAAFCMTGDEEEKLAYLSIMNSESFKSLVETRLNAADATARSYEIGIIEATPVPSIPVNYIKSLGSLAHRAWAQMRLRDSSTETSHAFVLPVALRIRLGGYDPLAVEAELARIQAEIDVIAYELYGFSEADRRAAVESVEQGEIKNGDEDEEDDSEREAPSADALLSWAVGVSFGRFDWRLASGERQPAHEPEPFDPLLAKSPGMLPDSDGPFHTHSGVLVDDPGHPHDLPRLIEDVLVIVDHPPPEDVRRWLRRDFFPHHLKQYSKSRRRAPIYWPLSAASGGYTLWLYYPALTDQTLYTAANDFVGPKLEETSRLATVLRTRANRSRDEERQLDQLQDLETELKEVQDELLRLAPIWKPNHDDGVQITAAPLWRLFRYRPWQTVLKETWEKLARGDYDWAHLAMAYWPDRVREKCRTDKSLAIAHDFEDLYEPPPEKPSAGRRGRKRAVRVA